MARVTSEKAVLAVGSRYDLILIAARRTRELKNGWKPMVDSVHNSDTVVALREIEQGHVGRDYLLKPNDVENKRKAR